MLVDVDSEIWFLGDHLYAWVNMPHHFHGSMMAAQIYIEGICYKARLFDLSGSIAVRVPPGSIARHKFEVGSRLTASIRVRPFKENVRIADDVLDHLKQTGSDLLVLPAFERRQALLYIAEATSSEVREARLAALVFACHQASGRTRP